MNTVHIGSRLHVCPSCIKLLRADLNYTHVHFYDKTPQIVSTTLKVLEGRLASKGFVRINRKELVNQKFVKAYHITPDRDYVELLDGSLVSPSRRGKYEVRKYFNCEES